MDRSEYALVVLDCSWSVQIMLGWYELGYGGIGRSEYEVVALDWPWSV